jgi:hypothetical protein
VLSFTSGMPSRFIAARASSNVQASFPIHRRTAVTGNPNTVYFRWSPSPTTVTTADRASAFGLGFPGLAVFSSYAAGAGGGAVARW